MRETTSLQSTKEDESIGNAHHFPNLLAKERKIGNGKYGMGNLILPRLELLIV